MTTDSKSASGFWLKVIFWLVIIILGFMYIRSLALNPKSEDTSAAVETSTAAHSTISGEVAGEADASAASSADDESDVTAETARQGGLEAGYSVSAPEQESIVESAPADAVESSADTDTGYTADTASTAEESVTSAEDDAAVTDSGTASSTSDEMQILRDMHAESVSKILKEFEDLRDATRAEIEAMRNRIQAERELREAMAPPPAWSRQGYSPYSGYPPSQQGYSPYYGR